MIRVLNILAVLGLIGSAIYAYSIKYETIYQAEKLAKIKSRIQKEQDLTAVLRAEWQLLNRPDRLQAIADRHLPDIVPLSPNQLARFSDLPARLERGDEIGQKLEALLGVPSPVSTGSLNMRPVSR
jgi:cell division protein FtsL